MSDVIQLQPRLDDSAIQARESQQTSRNERQSPTFGGSLVSVLKKAVPFIVGIAAAVAVGVTTASVLGAAACVVVGVIGSLYLIGRAEMNAQLEAERGSGTDPLGEDHPERPLLNSDAEHNQSYRDDKHNQRLSFYGANKPHQSFSPTFNAGNHDPLYPHKDDDHSETPLWNSGAAHYQNHRNDKHNQSSGLHGTNEPHQSFSPTFNAGNHETLYPHEEADVYEISENRSAISGQSGTARSMLDGTQWSAIPREVASVSSSPAVAPGTGDTADIFCVSSLDEVVTRSSARQSAVLNSAVAAQYGLDSVGAFTIYKPTESAADKCFLCQVKERCAEGFLVVASNLADIISGQAELQVPVDASLDVSCMPRIGSGHEANVYDKGNRQVVCAVDCRALLARGGGGGGTDNEIASAVVPKIRKRLRKILSLAQFDNYVNLNGFSLAKDGLTLYITMEKLEEVNFQNVSERDYRLMLKEFFQNLKKMRDANVIHGDVSPNNIMVRNNSGKKQLVLIDVGSYDGVIMTTRGYSAKYNGRNQDIQSAAVSLCDLINQTKYKDMFVNTLGKFRTQLYKRCQNDTKWKGFDHLQIFYLSQDILDDLRLDACNDGRRDVLEECVRFLSSQDNQFNMDVFNKYTCLTEYQLGAAAGLMMAVTELMEKLETLKASELISKYDDILKQAWGHIREYKEDPHHNSPKILQCLKAYVARQCIGSELCADGMVQYRNLLKKAISSGLDEPELFVRLIDVSEGTMPIDKMISYLDPEYKHV